MLIRCVIAPPIPIVGTLQMYEIIKISNIFAKKNIPADDRIRAK